MRNFTSVVTTLIFVVLSVNLFADCDMMGMVSVRGRYLSWETELTNSPYDQYNDPGDLFTWLKERSTNSSAKPNKDGYGLIYYPEDGSFHYNQNNQSDPLNQAWYLTGYDTYYNHSDPNDPNNFPLNEGVTKIEGNSTKASLVLGHARNGTGNYGSHPFRFEWNDQTYTFVHNGYTKLSSGDYLHNKLKTHLNSITWDYSSNWTSSPDYNDWIDSEVLFHYIMSYIIENNGDVLLGIQKALTENTIISNYIQDPSLYKNCINFALSDGESIYLFRNVDNDDHRLQYKTIKNGTKDKFYAFRTGGVDNYFRGTNLGLDHLIVLSPNGIYPNNGYNVFSSNNISYFTSGQIDSNINQPKIIITDDLNINNSSIVNTSNIEFWGNHKLTILGTLNINENGSLKLANASEIEISDNGVLKLNNGVTLSGEKGRVSGMPNPDYPSGNEPIYLGDRIVARDGGQITTGDKDEYLDNPGNPVTIESRSDNLWDGINIINPDHNQIFSFVNCEISGIKNL